VTLEKGRGAHRGHNRGGRTVRWMWGVGAGLIEAGLVGGPGLRGWRGVEGVLLLALRRFRHRHHVAWSVCRRLRPPCRLGRSDVPPCKGVWGRCGSDCGRAGGPGPRRCRRVGCGAGEGGLLALRRSRHRHHVAWSVCRRLRRLCRLGRPDVPPCKGVWGSCGPDRGWAGRAGRTGAVGWPRRIHGWWRSCRGGCGGSATGATLQGVCVIALARPVGLAGWARHRARVYGVLVAGFARQGRVAAGRPSGRLIRRNAIRALRPRVPL
jgi:hypothetical protein